MVFKKEIIFKHKKNLDTLKKLNKNYYIDDNPKVSDAEYDKIKLAALAFENKYSYLKKIKSVNDIVGSKPSSKFKKFKHLSPMLSLSNAFNIDDMKDFQKKLIIF